MRYGLGSVGVCVCVGWSLLFRVHPYTRPKKTTTREAKNLEHRKKALIVQEFVEHDLELRLYVVNGEARPPNPKT